MVSKIIKVIIIGAGPAGIACAIQLKRYNIDFIVLEKDRIGGLLHNANLVENYLGFPNGISGENLVRLMNKQSQSADINFKYESVHSVNYKNNFVVETNETRYTSKYLVVATGTKPIVPEVPIIQDSIKDKVFFDVHKLRQIKNKTIAIIGAGDCAFDYALNLSNNNKITILNRSNRIRALPILQERCSISSNIQYFENISVLKIKSINNQLLLLCDSSKELIADHLLITIGREPNLNFISRDLLQNPNIFQIGDVKNGQFRQLSIAVGDGTYTAMKISKLLNIGY